MITKYVTSYDARINHIEVESETEKSVWIKGRRRSKESGYERFHDTWEKAHAFLLDRETKNVEAIRRQLDYANGKLGNVKGMKKP